jgi:hypothetical protein
MDLWQLYNILFRLTELLYFIVYYAQRGGVPRSESLEHGFVNCGTRVITVTLIVVYWCAALKTSKYKKDKSFQK